jgi:hypothetical protein
MKFRHKLTEALYINYINDKKRRYKRAVLTTD